MRLLRRPALALILGIALLLGATASGWCLALCAMRGACEGPKKESCCQASAAHKACDSCSQQGALTAQTTSPDRSAAFAALPALGLLSAGVFLQIDLPERVVAEASGFAWPPEATSAPPPELVGARGPPPYRDAA